MGYIYPAIVDDSGPEILHHLLAEGVNVKALLYFVVVVSIDRFEKHV